MDIVFCRSLHERKCCMTELDWLRQENQRLIAENTHLKGLLTSHGISFQFPKEQRKPVDTTAEKERRIQLFMKLFCARKDFYAERWESKDGRKGYSPACRNRWLPTCPKKRQKGIKCPECSQHDWIPFTPETAYHHLTGQDGRGKAFVAGTYALLEDSTCKFLVFDFDDTDLFSANRFSGYDRVEPGQRVNYGFKWSRFNHKTKRSISALIGQSYRFDDDGGKR